MKHLAHRPGKEVGTPVHARARNTALTLVLVPVLILMQGLASADPTVVSTEVIGPFTGADAALHPGNQAPNPIAYYGTDLGFTYSHKGQLQILFGDTWATEAYAPIEASTGPSQDDGFGVIDLSQWPDPGAINSENIPLILLAQNPGTNEMSAQNPEHVMDLGKTPMDGFSSGAYEFAIFNVTKPRGCYTDSDCGPALMCDTGLGFAGVPFTQQDGLTLPCFDGMGACNASTMPEPDQASGFCSDPTSTIWDDTPAGRVQSTALNQRIGLRSQSDPRIYTDIQPWLTNKFVNVTTRTVQAFDPRSGIDPDYRTASAEGAERKVLLWGRPGFIGVGANGRTMGLYFAWVDMPSGPGFSWQVNYFTHTVNGVPQFSLNERDARPLDLDANQPGIQPAEAHDIAHQMSVAWIGELNKWVMFYGGGITILPSPPLPQCGVLQLFTGSECADVVVGNGAIRMRTADNPWGPWSPPQDVIAGGDPAIAGSGQYGVGGMLHHSACTAPGCAPHTQTQFYHPDEYGFFYAANIIEEWTRAVDGGVEVIWNASTWDPYRVVLLRTRINQ